MHRNEQAVMPFRLKPFLWKPYDEIMWVSPFLHGHLICGLFYDAVSLLDTMASRGHLSLTVVEKFNSVTTKNQNSLFWILMASNRSELGCPTHFVSIFWIQEWNQFMLCNSNDVECRPMGNIVMYRPTARQRLDKHLPAETDSWWTFWSHCVVKSTNSNGQNFCF
jgi:hypothetical protein